MTDSDPSTPEQTSAGLTQKTAAISVFCCLVSGRSNATRTHVITYEFLCEALLLAPFAAWYAFVYLLGVTLLACPL